MSEFWRVAGISGAIMISPSKLREWFEYEPGTGLLKRLVKAGRNCKLGVVSPRPNSHGYLLVKIDGKRKGVHQVAWAWMTGEWSRTDIDHINLNKADNRWSNLREATRSQNQANRSLSCNNTTGKKGVSFSRYRNKFSAQIRVGDRLIFLGRFGKLEEAAAAYDTAARRFFGEFARS